MRKLIIKNVKNYFKNNVDNYIIDAIERNERYETIIGKAINHRNQIYNIIRQDTDYISFFMDCEIPYQKMINMISDEIVNHVNDLWNN